MEECQRFYQDVLVDFLLMLSMVGLGESLVSTIVAHRFRNCLEQAGGTLTENELVPVLFSCFISCSVWRTNGKNCF